MMELFPDCLAGRVHDLSCCGLPDSKLIVETSVGLPGGQKSVESLIVYKIVTHFEI